jgi:hypothetical protein
LRLTHSHLFFFQGAILPRTLIPSAHLTTHFSFPLPSHSPLRSQIARKLEADRLAAELAKEDAFIRESRRRQQEALEAEARRFAEADAKVRWDVDGVNGRVGWMRERWLSGWLDVWMGECKGVVVDGVGGG